MTDTLALEQVFNDVRARFASESPGVSVVFGWREPTKQLNQGTGTANRIVFEPGRDKKAGTYTKPRRPGQNPRPLKTLVEFATVYVWAYDSDAPNDEMLQWKACRLLHDSVIRAVELSARGANANLPVVYSDPEWLGPNERRHGAELRFTLQLESQIPDVPLTEVLAGGEISHYINSDNAGPDELDGTDIYPEPSP